MAKTPVEGAELTVKTFSLLGDALKILDQIDLAHFYTTNQLGRDFVNAIETLQAIHIRWERIRKHFIKESKP